MKKIIAIILVLSAIFIAYFMASPYISTYFIQKALTDNNTEMLARHIDYTVLRENLKQTMRSELDSSLGDFDELLKDSNVNILLQGVSSKILDTLAEGMMTPQILRKIFQGQKTDILTDQSQQPKQEGDKKLLENASFHLDSLNHFSIWIPMQKDEKTQIILSRYGLTWKITHILFNKAKLNRPINIK